MGGSNSDEILSQPIVKSLSDKGYEIIICDDPIDEYVLTQIKEHDSHKIVNIGVSGFKIPESTVEELSNKKLTFFYEKLVTYIKKILPT